MIHSFHSVEKNWFESLDFLSDFELISMIVSNCNSLSKLNQSRENLVFFSGNVVFRVF